MNETIIEKVKNTFDKIRSTAWYITSVHFLSEVIKLSLFLFVVSCGLLSIFSISFQNSISAINGWIYATIGIYITEKKVYIPLIVCVAALVIRWFRKDYFLTREIIYQNDLLCKPLQSEMNLVICKEQIESITDKIESLKTEKEFIISCTPIPIVVTALAYVIEKAGFLSINWYVYISVCLLFISAYIFCCINHIRKTRVLFGRKRSWERTRSKLESFCQSDTKANPNAQHDQHRS